MTNLTSKATQRRVIALMCSGVPVTVCPPAPRPQTFTTHTGAVIPAMGEFDPNYLASVMGDQAIMPALDAWDDYGFDWGTGNAIARKRGQEWRDEIELQESGEIVGYWAEGL